MHGGLFEVAQQDAIFLNSSAQVIDRDIELVQACQNVISLGRKRRQKGLAFQHLEEPFPFMRNALHIGNHLIQVCQCLDCGNVACNIDFKWTLRLLACILQSISEISHIRCANLPILPIC